MNFRQIVVTVQEPAAEGDAVCLVVEFLRIDLIEVVQLIVFQDLRMEAGYAVDAEAVMDINVSHVYEVVFVDDVNGLIGVVPAYHIIQCIDDRGELGNDFFPDISSAISPEPRPGLCGWCKRRCGSRYPLPHGR